MYARLLASVCLLSVGAVAAPSERAIEGGKTIAVYSRHSATVPAAVSEAMRRETEALMESGGFRVQWLEEPHEVTAAFLVVVDLKGSCDPLPDAAIPPATQRLASTFVEDGRILPFITVDCAAVQQFLALALKGKRSPNPQFLYGRALARLLSHELYHVLVQTADHTGAGVTRAAVSARELVSDRFTFPEEALSKLHATVSVPATSKVEADAGAELDFRVLQARAPRLAR
jgi:hypothetical protein